jgi:hypothetical protein
MSYKNLVPPPEAQATTGLPGAGPSFRHGRGCINNLTRKSRYDFWTGTMILKLSTQQLELIADMAAARMPLDATAKALGIPAAELRLWWRKLEAAAEAEEDGYAAVEAACQLRREARATEVNFPNSLPQQDNVVRPGNGSWESNGAANARACGDGEEFNGKTSAVVTCVQACSVCAPDTMAMAGSCSLMSPGDSSACRRKTSAIRHPSARFPSEPKKNYCSSAIIPGAGPGSICRLPTLALPRHATPRRIVQGR